MWIYASNVNIDKDVVVNGLLPLKLMPDIAMVAKDGKDYRVNHIAVQNSRKNKSSKLYRAVEKQSNLGQVSPDTKGIHSQRSERANYYSFYGSIYISIFHALTVIILGHLALSHTTRRVDTLRNG